MNLYTLRSRPSSEYIGIFFAIVFMVTNISVASDLIATNSSQDYKPSINKIAGLTIIECVHVINEFTNIRLNGEVPSHYFPVDHKLYEFSFKSLNPNTPIEIVTSILKQNTNNLILHNKDGYDVVQRTASMEVNYPLDRMLKEFSIENGDLLDAFRTLCKFDSDVYFFYPFLVGGQPETQITDFEREQFGGRKISFRLKNVTIRDVLNKVAEAQSNMYWISESLEYQGRNDVLISMYSDKAHFGQDVIQNHDPEVQQRIKKLMQEQDMQWEEDHKKTISPQPSAGQQ